MGTLGALTHSHLLRRTGSPCPEHLAARGGLGLFSFPVDHTIACMNILIQHFCAPFVLGKKFDASLECLQLEVGCRRNPLLERYRWLGFLATDWPLGQWLALRTPTPVRANVT